MTCGEFDCDHVMVTKCPKCKRRLRDECVWDFSHAGVCWDCGYRVTERLRPAEPLPTPVMTALAASMTGLT